MATNIEWTATKNDDGTVTKGQTWNPTTGCNKISAGCKFCYAEKMHKRLQGMGQVKYSQPFTTFVMHHDELTRRFGKTPTTIFVDSMSDLFHEKCTTEFIQQVFDRIAAQPWHIFQVLTKRIDRAYGLSSQLEWPDNLWLGTSVEDDRVLDRITYLQETDAKIKFLSIEPLIGPLNASHIAGVDWVIVGGESSSKARPMEWAWVEAIRERCAQQGIAFFFKQWGGKNKKLAGRLLNGRTYDEKPAPIVTPLRFSDTEFAMIAHTLGVDVYSPERMKERDKWLPEEFYRNYYNTSDGADYETMNELVRKGYMATNRKYYFHVVRRGFYQFYSEFYQRITRYRKPVLA